ncbi:MAG TPA: glycosyltransferase family 39 protein, partial [Dehalococcoidia bacterium]|nr:glycosyltransferase family 39 protein [Dehalococcoidia bacterium]
MVSQAPALPDARLRLDALKSVLATRWPLLAVGAIFCVAFAIRAIDVTTDPLGFFADEAAAGVDAHAILTTGRDQFGHTLPFFFQSLGDYKLPVFIYSELPFVGLLGLNELAVRLTVATLGSLTIVTTYLMAGELFSPRDAVTHTNIDRLRAAVPAFAAAVMLATMPWHIHYSRTGFGELVSLPLVFTLATWLFLRAIRRETSLIPAAIAFGVCFYTYRGGWVVLPPFLLVLLLVYERELGRSRRDALIALAVFGVLLLPLARHLLFGPADRASTAWIFNVPGDQSTTSLFWQHYRSYFSLSFLFQHGDNSFILRHYLPGQGELYWFQLPLILLALGRMAWHWDKRYVLLLALLVLYPLSGALSDQSPISSRTILGSVTFALLTGLGVATLVDLAAVSWPRASRVATIGALAIVAVVLSLSLGAYLQRYFDDYPALSAGYWGWQDGPQQIIGDFLAVQDDYDELILDGQFNAPEIFFPFYAGDQCVKCRVGGPELYIPNLHQLFALRAENPDLPNYSYIVLRTLRYPDGSPSF